MTKLNNTSLKSYPKNLLIIGNGFDLYCGLDSTFTDFLIYEMNKQQKKLLSTGISHSFNPGNDNYNLSKFNLKDPDLEKYIKTIINFYNSLYINLFLPIKSKVFSDKNLKSSLNKSDVLHILFTIYGFNDVVHNFTDNKSIDLVELLQKIYGFYINYTQDTTHTLHQNFWLLYLEFMLSMYLSSHKYKRYNIQSWSDIETQIMLFLRNYSRHVYNFLVTLTKYYNQDNMLLFLNKLYKRTLSAEASSDADIPKEKIQDNPDNMRDTFIVIISSLLLMICDIFHDYHLYPGNNSKKDLLNEKGMKNYHNFKSFFYRFILSQLYKLEDMFSSYMSNHVLGGKKDPKGIKSKYNKKCQALVNKLLPNDNQEFNLLSFNYTVMHKCLFNNLIVRRNVHSELESKNTNGHPIFGVDNNMCNNDDIIFSKTYRIMALSNSIEKEPLLPNSINNLIFFGHSLGAEDYSYFQAIFDRYNIYNNLNIRLIFCYSVHNSKGNVSKNDSSDDSHYKDAKVKCAKSMYHAVSNLLNEYGKTFNNKNHGKNLWHRLLLENRLIIHCIDDSYF